MKASIIILSLSLLAAGGCKSKLIPKPDTTTITGEKLYDAVISEKIAATSLDLFKATVKKSEAGKNIIISPLSIQVAMAMATNGANANTLNQLATLYNISPADLDKLNAHYADLVTNLTGDKDFQLSVANAVFYDPSRLTIKKPYLDKIKASYIPYEKTLNFQNVPASTAEINDWAKSKTNGRIQKVLENIDAAEFMFLVNALYMKADWDMPFAPEMTSNQDFTLSAGTKESVPFMRKDFNPVVYESSAEKAVVLPLANSRLKLALILPSGGDINSYIDALDYSKLKAILSTSSSRHSMLTLPKLKIESKYDMKEVLKYMNITDAFDESKADFSKIGNGNIILTRVLHDIFFNMDEKGVEGAAVTTVGVGVTSLPMPISFNRPFVLAVYHPGKNVYLFLGKIESPKIAE